MQTKSQSGEQQAISYWRTRVVETLNFEERVVTVKLLKSSGWKTLKFEEREVKANELSFILSKKDYRLGRVIRRVVSRLYKSEQGEAKEISVSR